MPTGYTAKLMESGQTFQEFVMECARAFGACIEMRDEPHGTPIPQRFEPSNYSAECLSKAKAELARLHAMTEAERIAFGESNRNQTLAHNQEWLARETAQNNRLEEMGERVGKWIPPTADHEELKKFMLQQIDISKNKTSYIEKTMAETRAKSSRDFHAEAIAAAVWSVEYHTKESAKEVERANSRTEWVQQLRASIQPK